MTNEEREALITQGWTPPVVDSDIAEARQIYHNSLPSDPIGMTLIGIKRGRALANVEAKPGVIWAKHNGSDDRPVSFNRYVFVLYKNKNFAAMLSIDVTWSNVTHYAIIPPPAKNVA